MAHSLSLGPMLHLLILLIFTWIQFQPSSSNDLVNDICAHNEDPAYCNQVFSSDVRTPGADLAGLGQISIDQGLALATNISNLVIWKNTTETDPSMKKCFSICEVLYDSAKDNLVKASDSVGRRDFGSMNINGHLAQQDGLDCDEAFTGRQSPIAVENRHFIDLTHATVVISNMLVKQ